jgi:hypothetical protein
LAQHTPLLVGQDPIGCGSLCRLLTNSRIGGRA